MIGGEFPIPLFVGRRTNRPVHVTVACLSRTIAKLPGGRVASLARPLSRSLGRAIACRGSLSLGDRTMIGCAAPPFPAALDARSMTGLMIVLPCPLNQRVSLTFGDG